MNLTKVFFWWTFIWKLDDVAVVEGYQHRPVIYAWFNVDIKYNAASHPYLSAQTYLFSHIVLRYSNGIFRYFKNSMIPILCAAVVAESCFLFSEKWVNT